LEAGKNSVVLADFTKVFFLNFGNSFLQPVNFSFNRLPTRVFFCNLFNKNTFTDLELFNLVELFSSENFLAIPDLVLKLTLLLDSSFDVLDLITHYLVDLQEATVLSVIYELAFAILG
jgi:hypothetical protein